MWTMFKLTTFQVATLTFILHVQCVTVDAVDVTVKVDTEKSIGQVDESFIGATLDTSRFSSHWQNVSFASVRLRTLLRALSPAQLRVGGTSADWLFFDKPAKVLQAAGLEPDVGIMTRKDFSELVELTRSTGTRLMFDLNLQQRFGEQWNPCQAIEIFQFCTLQGYGENIDWELGNEPDDFSLYKGALVLSGEQIGRDYVELRRVLDRFPALSNSSVLGPALGGPYNKLAPDIILGVVNQTGDFLKALTFHHYYFRGDTASYKEYINPENFGDLVFVIDRMKTIVRQSKYPGITLWLGETSDAWHSGTLNVSDRFVSGFLWLEKLGLSAQMGVKTVIRQTLLGGNYPLVDTHVNPNPDYWLTLLHRQLVGPSVLGVEIFSRANTTTSQSEHTTRVYAHCTKTGPGSRYKAGAVTVFALNVSPDVKSQLIFNEQLRSHQPVDVYMLSPCGPDGILSKSVLLNGRQRLELVDDVTLPSLEPVRLPAYQPVTVEPLTFGFFVFPSSSATACLE